MPKILIRNLNNKTISANETDATILDIIHSENIDWMHACGGKGKCTTCKMIVHSGLSSFGPDTEPETRLRGLDRLAENERLACQCQLKADIEVSVAESNKFPHVEYSA
ncbi:2Fe-2S iron-sulfur cluster-binding protein [Roseivirga misakiensis]|uniref:Ferredoxin n=1 Tax=Roseivirga misakiensis TaxID=1563681 RepID=A0A1E5T625_9BACT|nr:2Fe-2S iron-sulfur cluster-binding protein [Roseivirga misakiensis]OEK06810.1 ferredoxin [Roseivirga misakiensis]